MNNKIIDYNDGLQRFMDDSSLYEKFLCDFIKDKTFSEVKKAYGAKQGEELKNTVHTLKGISGNLSLSRLFFVCDSAMKYLRSGNNLITEEMYLQITDAYYEAINEIKKLYERG